MNKTAKKEAKIDLGALNENRLSKYSLIIDLFSLTTFALLISILMLMHKKIGGAVYDNWVIIVVGLSLELLFIGLSVLDSIKKNPLERMYGSSIFNLPIFTITVLIITAIYWGRAEQLAIVYGAICGGFAGYLAGGLAYGNFFVKIKDTVFRIVFGGWIGVSIGAICGALFAGLVDPFGGRVFGGIFMGFWGGAIVSGPLAVVLLLVLEKNIAFRNFFSKILVFDFYRKVKLETEDILLAAAKDNPKIIMKHLTSHELLNVKGETDDKKETESFWKKAQRIFLYIVFLINPWEIESEINRVNAYRDVFALYFSEKYLKSLKQSTKDETEKYTTTSDAGSKLRQTIIRALECIPVERSKDMILYALKDQNVNVTLTAIESLGNMKMKEAVHHLLFLQGEAEYHLFRELKTDRTKKLEKSISKSLEKIFERSLTSYEKVAGKIIYTKIDSTLDAMSLIPINLIQTPRDVIEFYHALVDAYKKSQKMAIIKRNHIEDIIDAVAKFALTPEDFLALAVLIVDENLKNLAKKMVKNKDVFI